MMRQLLLPGAMLLLGACSGSRNEVESQARMEHGLTVGRKVPPVQVECPDSVARTVGGDASLQMVTFVTPFDCTECTPHLAGVASTVKKHGLADRAFMVMWSPELARNGKVRTARELGLPVCVNRDGSLWDAHNLLHTPFTAVIRDGTVVYLHDGTFSQPEHADEFAADLKQLFTQR